MISAINDYSNSDFPVAHTLFFELHGSEAGVAEQMDLLADIAQNNGCGDFEFANTQEEKTTLWQARHDAYYAALRQRTGAVGWATDVCVPISRLSECIQKTREDLENISVPSCILGHIGDGNFHVVFSLDEHSEAEFEAVKAFSKRLSRRAISMDGTCTGEHGVGLGKKDMLSEEHGPALDVMKQIKGALDLNNILNPGKIFTTKADANNGAV